MRITRGFAGERALAANIDGFERVDLTGVGNADYHSILAFRGWIGRSGLHPAELDRDALILIELRKIGRSSTRLSWKRKLRTCSYISGRFLDRFPIARDELRADTVVRFRARKIRLDHTLAGRRAASDRGMNVIDGGVFDLEAFSRKCRRRGEHRDPQKSLQRSNELGIHSASCTAE